MNALGKDQWTSIGPDGGQAWHLSGLDGIPVNAVAVDTATPANAYAGTAVAGAFRMTLGDSMTALAADHSTNR